MVVREARVTGKIQAAARVVARGVGPAIGKSKRDLGKLKDEHNTKTAPVTEIRGSETCTKQGANKNE